MGEREVNRTHRGPPGAGVLQATVITVFQTAGVRNSASVVHLKPVSVVGHATAPELKHPRRIAENEVFLLQVT